MVQERQPLEEEQILVPFDHSDNGGYKPGAGGPNHDIDRHVARNQIEPLLKTCGTCGLKGHNRRTCGGTQDVEARLPEPEIRKCTICRGNDHNRRTCPDRIDKEEEQEMDRHDEFFSDEDFEQLMGM